ncbi:hypothetical protein KL86APRO_10815 [uncultured Alphaproteobacteria bacterium]|uniref:Uncharacterized protein n=1 Tax=uncultured Alphaproteobacteria bacterium TaxID=91750 RepID=A0A212JBU2_9PROT|nr:hypothetical protein KL86APRO_10815 [uncultured Alphaproteobacteria bacterium]
MTDDEMLALDTQMKLQALILMVRNLYAYVDGLEGRTGRVADGLRAFLDESLPNLEMPVPVPPETLAAIKAALAEPLRATIADIEAGAPQSPPPPPRFTLVKGGIED